MQQDTVAIFGPKNSTEEKSLRTVDKMLKMRENNIMIECNKLSPAFYMTVLKIFNVDLDGINSRESVTGGLNMTSRALNHELTTNFE